MIALTPLTIFSVEPSMPSYQLLFDFCAYIKIFLIPAIPKSFEIRKHQATPISQFYIFWHIHPRCPAKCRASRHEWLICRGYPNLKSLDFWLGICYENQGFNDQYSPVQLMPPALQNRSSPVVQRLPARGNHHWWGTSPRNSRQVWLAQLPGPMGLMH